MIRILIDRNRSAGNNKRVVGEKHQAISGECKADGTIKVTGKWIVIFE